MSRKSRSDKSYDETDARHSSDSPSLRQRLASAMGDRHAEAGALADRAGDEVGAAEAEIAVREAHGDIAPGADDGSSETLADNELASPADAAAVRDRDSR